MKLDNDQRNEPERSVGNCEGTRPSKQKRLKIALSDLRVSYEGRETQMRAETDEETVERYAEAMVRGDKFPPIDVVPHEDGKSYYITDGWHRVAATEQLRELDRRRTAKIEALVHPVPEGVRPLDYARRRALVSNTTHGLQLNHGDQQRRAEVVCLLPENDNKTVRTLEAEYGIGRSTISRARRRLVAEGKLPDHVTGETLPGCVPEEYALAQRKGQSGHALLWDYDLRESVFSFVSELKAFAPKEWTFEYEKWASGDNDDDDQDDAQWNGHVEHHGLIEGKVVSFRPFLPNSVKSGMPKIREIIDPNQEPPSDEQRARWDAAKRKRELKKAWAALEGRLKPDQFKSLQWLVETVSKYDDLGDDVRLVLLGESPGSDY